MASRDGANLGCNAIESSSPANSAEIAAVDKAAAGFLPTRARKSCLASGSTGLPKGVVNTHGMLTANQQQLCQVWPFLFDQPLTLVDSLP